MGISDLHPTYLECLVNVIPALLMSMRSEYGAFWKCFQASGIYIFIQVIKMLILATFVPTTDNVVEGVDMFGDLIKLSIDLIDYVGKYLVLSSIPGKGHAKILTAGVGWAGAEVILTRFLDLWVGARGAEFDWKYIQNSLDSNICLVHHVATVTLVWLWSRHDLNRSAFPIVVMLLSACAYKQFLFDFLYNYLHFTRWNLLLVNALFTSVVGVITLNIYSNMAKVIGLF
uniref:BOS complex subunit TMEM147 n=1 Tax=Cacopsylla melanoneura TaxID=428564 RepID=A0A8D8RDW6_9HEMI